MQYSKQEATKGVSLDRNGENVYQVYSSPSSKGRNRQKSYIFMLAFLYIAEREREREIEREMLYNGLWMNRRAQPNVPSVSHMKTTVESQ